MDIFLGREKNYVIILSIHYIFIIDLKVMNTFF